ncbi:F-box protein-like protein [Tanacetum coccineum]
MEGVNKRRRLMICRQQLENVPELKRRRLIHRKQLEDVPELIQQIQSLLPADQAARTCVVSKSWLHALSTTPDLRFQPVKYLDKQEERQYRRLIHRTLRTYQRENIPIITCALHFGIHNQKSAYRAKKWIKHITSNTCLKELCLAIVLDINSFTLPDEIFSYENLNTLSLKLDDTMDDLLTMSKRKSEHALHMKTELFRKKNFRISSNPVIACVNLRVLELVDVHISEEVNNLCYLVAPKRYKDILEIHDVPSLRSFLYEASRMIWMPVSVLSNVPSIGNLRELNIDGVRMDDAFLNVINSGFPHLESLTLDISSCVVEIMDIRCVTLKRLKIRLMMIENQQLRLELIHPIDHMLILKMRETLELSSKFSIEIESSLSALIVPFDIDDERTPATNVEKLLFERISPKNLQDKSLLIDALFSICRPNQVEVSYLLAHNVAIYLSVVEKKTRNVYWSHVEIRDPEDGKWETLSTSSISLLDEWFHSTVSLVFTGLARILVVALEHSICGHFELFKPISVGKDICIVVFDLETEMVADGDMVDAQCIGFAANPVDSNLFCVQTSVGGRQLRLWDTRCKDGEFAIFGWEKSRNTKNNPLSGAREVKVFDNRYQEKQVPLSCKKPDHSRKVYQVAWAPTRIVLVSTGDRKIRLH